MPVVDKRRVESAIKASMSGNANLNPPPYNLADAIYFNNSITNNIINILGSLILTAIGLNLLSPGRRLTTRRQKRNQFSRLAFLRRNKKSKQMQQLLKKSHQVLFSNITYHNHVKEKNILSAI